MTIVKADDFNMRAWGGSIDAPSGRFIIDQLKRGSKQARLAHTGRSRTGFGHNGSDVAPAHQEAGIYPARPGRIAMLSDADVTKLMEQSRRRGRVPNGASETSSSDDAGHQRARNRQDLLTEVMDLQRLVDKAAEC